MDEIVTLRAETERLRELLIENGIDPEPYVEPPPQFGPPTLLEHLMHKAAEMMFKQAAIDIMKPSPILHVPSNNHVSQGANPPTHFRIRLPADFSVTR